MNAWLNSELAASVAGATAGSKVTRWEIDLARGVTFSNNIPALYAHLKGHRSRLLVHEFYDESGMASVSEQDAKDALTACDLPAALTAGYDWGQDFEGTQP